jgi:hypothetical protein
VPVLLADLDKASRFGGVYDEGQALAAAADALARVGPDDEAAVRRLVELAGRKRADKDEKGNPVQVEWPEVQVAALRALGEVGRVQPPRRAALAPTLTAALERAPLRLEAAAALARYGRQRLDPAADMRAAATDAVKEIERRRTYAVLLGQAGIDDVKTPPPLYEAAFAVVTGQDSAEAVTANPPKEGDPPPREEVAAAAAATPNAFRTLSGAPRLSSTLRVLAGLARLPDAPEARSTPARLVGVHLLVRWGEDRRRRTQLAAALAGALIPVLDVGPLREEVLAALLRCGPEAVRQLRALEASPDEATRRRAASALESLGRVLTDALAQQDAGWEDLALAAAERGSCSSQAAAALARGLSWGEARRRAAALALEKCAAAAGEQALRMQAFLDDASVQDPVAKDHVRQALKNMGLDPRSKITLLVGLVKNERTPKSVRFEAAATLAEPEGVRGVRALGRPESVTVLLLLLDLLAEDPRQIEPDPGRPRGPGFEAGKSFLFRVTGSASDSGTLYGADVYTDDSPIAKAAVHAGVLKDGQTGVVRLTLLPLQKSYDGTTRNGVTSNSYGSWGNSYSLEAAKDWNRAGLELAVPLAEECGPEAARAGPALARLVRAHAAGRFKGEGLTGYAAAVQALARIGPAAGDEARQALEEAGRSTRLPAAERELARKALEALQPRK